MSASPIRVGFIGLSAKAWAAAGHAPYLLSSDKYQIVALANSSEESAKAAIKAFNLPETTKAYGSPEELANDPNVQLVVDSVRVDNHYATLVPSLKAGKDVFVEWPLGKSLAEAEELLQLAKDGGVKSAYVNLQAAQHPAISKINELITQGRIGKVLSSTFVGQIGQDIHVLPKSSAYMYDSKVGGSTTTIGIAHIAEAIQHAFGEPLVLSSSLLTNRRPEVTIVEDDGTLVQSTSDTPDTNMFLATTATTGVPLSFFVRPGAPMKGTHGLDWRISGTTGEIRITAANCTLNITSPDIKITLSESGKDELEEVEIPTDVASALPVLFAQNIARQYEAIAAKDGKHLTTFEQAIERHRFVEDMLKANGFKTA